jgi:sugar phosphate isomerase/epimerase
MKDSRRKFIQQTAMGIAGSLSLPFLSRAAPAAAYFKKDSPLQIGVAGYTFAKFDLEKSIEMMKRLNLKNLSVKDIHLPLNSDADKIKSAMGKFSAADINVYTVGVVYMKTKVAVDQAFSYAQKVGVDMIVGVPNYELLDHSEQKVKETGIRLAIHNHGPEDALYPGPQDVYDRVKNGPSYGIVSDIGHAVGSADLVKSIKAHKDRLFDLHIKDVTAAAKDAKLLNAEV